MCSNQMQSGRFLWRRSIAILFLLLGVLACNLPTTLSLSTPTNPAGALKTGEGINSRPTPAPTLTPIQPAIPTSTLAPATSAPKPAPPSPTPTIAYQAVFEPGDCAFSVPPGTSPECGYLIVPENRASQDSPLIRLHLAVFHSTSANPDPVPVLYLSGGPGSPALDLTPYVFQHGLGGVLATHDLIVFDQRGTGHSQPDMSCPEREIITSALLKGGLSTGEKEQMILDAFRACHDRLAAQGIDLTAYNSAAIAEDVNDLRQALGYDQVNLYGVSYGTRIALTVMRDDPGAVRSAVLDSTLPPQVNLYASLAPDAERAFNRLFESCAVDPACNTAYPDLKNVFYNLVDQLNASPMPVTLQSGSIVHPVLVDGGLLVDVLFVGLYNPVVAAEMPKMIYELLRGDTGILKERLWLYFENTVALGMQMSVICSEEIPFSEPEEAFVQAQGVQPQIASFFPESVRPLFAACQEWNPSPPDPRENQPVESSIPALLLAGDFDPITPPDWGRLAAEGLSQSYFYTFPANGHWVTRSSLCALSVAFAFWDDPTAEPDSTCIADIRGLNYLK